jgi:hypothetical protein
VNGRIGEWASGRVGEWACRRVRLVLVLPTSLATELPAAKSKSYVGAGCARGACVGFPEPNAWRVVALSCWQIWWFAAAERLPGRQAAPENAQRSAVIPYKWNGARGRPADRAKYSRNRPREPLAANLLICYLIKRLPASGVRTEDICGCLPPVPPFF